MLSLQLKSGEYVKIGDDIAVQVFQLPGSAFRVAVKAPREVPIVRSEVLERVGEQRPGGLQKKRPKSPSDQIRNAKRLQLLAKKQDARRREDALLQEMRAILDGMDSTSAQALRGKLDAIEEGRNAV